MLKRVLKAGLVLFLVWAMASCAQANVRTTKIRQGVDRKVTELMILAQQARNAGDMANAELFWMHARELRPSLPRPSWLDRRPEPISEQLPPAEDELLARIASLPYEQAKMLLEERLEREPGNEKVRRMFLELAQRSSDHAEIARHQSLLTIENSNSWRVYLWYVLGLLLLLLLAWQITALYRDLTR